MEYWFFRPHILVELALPQKLVERLVAVPEEPLPGAGPLEREPVGQLEALVREPVDQRGVVLGAAVLGLLQEPVGQLLPSVQTPLEEQVGRLKTQGPALQAPQCLRTELVNLEELGAHRQYSHYFPAQWER